MNELACTQEIHPTETQMWSRSFGSQELSAEMEYSDMKLALEEDRIFMETAIQNICKEYLAEHAQELIDKAITTYILDRKNRKLEKKSFSLVATKKNVKK